jgi:integrase/recombinase XerD
MKFSDGINQYVTHKQAIGIKFESGRRYLVSLSRRIGDIDLSQIKIEQVLTFLNNSDAAVATWRLKYYALLRFFDFWASRGAMPYLPLPPPRLGARQSFIPYVYSRAELRTLLRLKEKNQRITIDQPMMRAFLLTVYGTGASVGEVIGLLVEDVNLKTRNIAIRNKSPSKSRRIPICNDLCEILQKYLSWRCKRNFQNPHLFVTKGDHPAPLAIVRRSFRRRCEFAKIIREESAIYQPRLQDLRCTFAVHRITSWIRSKTDLNRMLPALASYMGLELCSSERYLFMTPERFKKHLNRLSPNRGQGKRWRSDKRLMAFLNSL